MLVPATSSTRQRVAVLLQAQYKALGVQIDVTPLDPALFFARLQKGDFDAALNMWHADPSPGAIREVWGTARGSDVAGNFGRFSDAHVDDVLDRAARTFDAARRVALYREAHQAIVDAAPALWLYEPRNIAVISTRVVPTGMRADAWWARLADWTPASRAVATNAR